MPSLSKLEPVAIFLPFTKINCHAEPVEAEPVEALAVEVNGNALRCGASLVVGGNEIYRVRSAFKEERNAR